MHNIWLVILISFLYYVSSSASNDPLKYEYPAGSLACKTHNMTEMDCSNRYLVDIPFLDQNLATTLDLSYNQLTEIKGAPFEQLPLLRTLNLSYNEISHLSSIAFRGIWFLVELDLKYNNINTLPSGIFFNLTKLENIDLLINWLYTIPNEALEHEALQEIYLNTIVNFSKISKIRFHGSNLQSLQLQAMLISNIHNDTFQNFAQLPLQAFTLYVSNYRVSKKYICCGKRCICRTV